MMSLSQPAVCRTRRRGRMETATVSQKRQDLPSLRSARRWCRWKELTEKGQTADLAKIEEDINERDYQDMHREHSPLVQAEDAVLVDSSEMTIDEVVEKILSLARERM